MKYSDLIKVKNTKEKAPSLTPESLTPAQARLADEGKCIHCGVNSATKTSFLCHECEGNETLDSIKRDVQSLRNKIMKDHHGGG
jgi:hypothetical protein